MERENPKNPNPTVFQGIKNKKKIYIKGDKKRDKRRKVVDEEGFFSVLFARLCSYIQTPGRKRKNWRSVEYLGSL